MTDYLQRRMDENLVEAQRVAAFFDEVVRRESLAERERPSYQDVRSRLDGDRQVDRLAAHFRHDLRANLVIGLA